MNEQQKEKIIRYLEPVDLSDLIWIDPHTGLPTYDLRKATPGQLAALDIEETTVRSGATVTRTVRIKPKKGAIIK